MFAQFKIYIILGLIILGLCGTITILFQRLEAVKDDRDRNANNYNVVQSDLKRFKDKSGADAITIQELQLTKAELRNEADSLKLALYKQARILGNKNKQIQQLIDVKTSVQIKEVLIPIHDTVFIDGKTHRIAEVSSKWLDVSILVQDDSLNILNYESRDDIVIVLKRFKTSKWFFPKWFEKWKYAADIKSMNPNSKITHAENIRVTGKRGR